MALSDLAVRQAKATGKDYTLADLDGLALFVAAQGGKSWHFRYYWLGKQKRMSLGPYPAVTLREARALREEARTHLLEVIGRIEARKSLSVAEKVRTWLHQLFEYATVVTPGMKANPASSLDVVAVPLPPVQHNPFLRIPELPEFLRTLRRYPGELQTQLAIRLLLTDGCTNA